MIAEALIHTIVHGDCRLAMKARPDNFFDSVVTDPPYALRFMGKKWDVEIPGVDVWGEVLRVCKPGAHLLAFGGTRTHHRLMVAIEDAGWEIRDTLGWIYGSGFPKSLDVSKALEAKVLTGSSNKTRFKYLDGEKGKTSLGYSKIHADNDRPNNYNGQDYNKSVNLTTDVAKQWAGWGTALKPAWEPIVLARKPLDGTVAGNVVEWGVGGINIDGCRISINPEIDDPRLGGVGVWTTTKPQTIYGGGNGIPRGAVKSSTGGRFPANIIHDGSDEVISLFPEEAGAFAPVKSGSSDKTKDIFGKYKRNGDDGKSFRGDSGSAARFFYCAKASADERNMGGADGDHPTVKPLSLIQYLCRLITPPGGHVFDPFGGSGTTTIAANVEGFNSTLVEIEADYIKDIRKKVQAGSQLDTGVVTYKFEVVGNGK